MSEIVDAIKEISIRAVEQGKPSAVLFGTVQTVSPLTVFVDQKTILQDYELVLSRNVTDHQTQISFDNPSVKNEMRIGNHPLAPDGTLTTNPDTPAQTSCPAILEGNLSFTEKVKHDITLYNALKVGEGVILLRMQGGQRFIVLDRIGVL